MQVQVFSASIFVTDLKTIVELIGNTTTKTGLKIKTKVDEKTYEKGRKVANKSFNSIALKKMDFHGEWNYTIQPNNLEM